MQQELTIFVMDHVVHSRHMNCMLSKADIVAALTRKVNAGEITQKAIAEAMGVAPPRVSELFKGDRDLSLDEAKSLVERFGIDEGSRPVSVGIPPEVILSVLEWVYQRLDLPEREAQMLARASVVVMKQTAESEAIQADPELIQSHLNTAFGILDLNLTRQ